MRINRQILWSQKALEGGREGGREARSTFSSAR